MFRRVSRQQKVGEWSYVKAQATGVGREGVSVIHQWAGGLSIIIQYQNMTTSMTDKAEAGKAKQFSRKKIEAYSYGLSDEIGKGYSSRVYRGRHDETDENVAVKVIDLKMLKNDINRELLYSEIEILKELRDSPHVLRLCDIFSTRNNTYIITELCSGDLSSAIKQGLPPAQALLHMHQILQGYLQFHGKRVVHRDLKPANILLTHCGLIKIADFGFAIKAEALGKGSKYNVGSPLYMAPESLKKNDYSYKSDIWALGVIFYEMLFADTPWRAKNEKELLRKIENEPIETVLASKTLSLPPNARDFLTRCLRVDKHARMGPEELHAFSFTPTVAPHNVLGEKTLNIAHRVTGNDSIALGSPLQEKKSLRMQRSVEDMHEGRRGKGQDENMENGSIYHKNTKVVQHAEGHIKLKTEQAEVLRGEPLGKEQKKLISKMLISEVHFCRFLFKLLQKIKESTRLGLLKGIHREEIDRINDNYTAIIRRKIQQLLAFKDHNFLKCEGYREYRWTSDCDKLIKIAKEYSERYRADLQPYWEGGSDTAGISLEPTNRLIAVLYELLDRQVAGMANPGEEIGLLSREVVVLDYLVTAQQLLEMIASSPEGYQRFARKSRIEEIVEGRTVDIHLDLFGQIMQRVRHIMQRPQFVSFGFELTE